MFTNPRRILIGIVLLTMVLALFIGFSAPTLAQPDPDTADCWGIVTSQRASDEPGSVGEHASSEPVPRAGLANIAQSLGFDHLGEFGSFLAEVDGIEATHCP